MLFWEKSKNGGMNMSENKQRMGFRIYKDIPRPTPDLLERLNKFTVPEL